jgi:predicted ABC-type ATPase
MAAQERKVIIIAGPNGAGKTTFAREFLPHEAACPVFVNADLIAAGLAPFAPESAAVQAGRLMLSELDGTFRRVVALPLKPRCRAAPICAISRVAGGV